MFKHENYLIFRQFDNFELSWAWKGFPNQPPKYLNMNAFIKNVKMHDKHIEIKFTDKGVLLEKNAVNYKQMHRSEIISDILKNSALKLVLDWKKSSFDDVIDYSSSGSTTNEPPGSSSPRIVKSVGKPRDGPHLELNILLGKLYKSIVRNHCPECNKDGKIIWVQGKEYHHCAKEDNGGVGGMYTCCRKLKGCDTDFTISGLNRNARYKNLEVVSPPAPTDKPITLAGGDVSGPGKEESSNDKSY